MQRFFRLSNQPRRYLTEPGSQGYGVEELSGRKLDATWTNPSIEIVIILNFLPTKVMLARIKQRNLFSVNVRRGYIWAMFQKDQFRGRIRRSMSSAVNKISPSTSRRLRSSLSFSFFSLTQFACCAACSAFINKTGVVFVSNFKISLTMSSAGRFF